MGNPHLSVDCGSLIKEVPSYGLIWVDGVLYVIMHDASFNRTYQQVCSINGELLIDIIKRYDTLYAKATCLMRQNFLIDDYISGKFTHNQYIVIESIDEQGFACKHKVQTINVSKINKPPTHSALPCHPGKSFHISDKIQYVKISSFSTLPNIELDYHAEALVIDLRNNPGGIVENATACISHFLRMPLMVKEYCLMTKNEVKSLRVEGRKEGGHANKRMYVLINEHTMSSAEYVFALIAKCYLGATLVSCQSAGISG